MQRCIISSPTFDCHDHRALHAVSSWPNGGRPACASLAICLPACLQASVALPSTSSQRRQKVRRKEGRRDPGTVGSQEGKTQRAEEATNHQGSFPGFTGLLSPSSPPCASLHLPPSPTASVPAMSCMLVMRARGWGAQKATSQSNQIRSTPLLPSPKSSQLSGLALSLPAIWEGFTRLCLIFPSWLHSSYHVS